MVLIEQLAQTYWADHPFCDCAVASLQAGVMPNRPRRKQLGMSGGQPGLSPALVALRCFLGRVKETS